MSEGKDKSRMPQRAPRYEQQMAEIVAVRDEGDFLVQVLDHEFETDREIWERQPWESDFQFEIFTIYRDLPPMRRSLSEALRQYKKDIPDDVNNKDIDQVAIVRVSQHNLWVERVESYSMYIDDKLRGALEEERIRTRIEYLDLGREMREKASQAIKVMQATVYDEDGTERVLLSPRQIIDLARAAKDFEQFALLMEDQQQAGPTVNIMNISDSALVAKAREVLDARERR